jgi:hypothetical protein
VQQDFAVDLPRAREFLGVDLGGERFLRLLPAFDPRRSRLGGDVVEAVVVLVVAGAGRLHRAEFEFGLEEALEKALEALVFGLGLAPGGGQGEQREGGEEEHQAAHGVPFVGTRGATGS